MPKLAVEKSIEINASAAKVRTVIQDYQQWVVWSPWLCMEPEAQLKFAGTAGSTGHSYSWEGDMVGAGHMELTAIETDTDRMNLTFLKPFKSKAKVEFETTAIDADNTRVTWRMDSSMPFFLFFMVGTMKSMIAMDYDRGLRMLKEYVETGAVTSTIEVLGIVDVQAINYVGESADCPLNDMQRSMEQTFAKLSQKTGGNPVEDYCGSIYHSMNVKTQHCGYTCFAPVDEARATGSIAACKALKVVHTGSYQHLGNAWSTANSYQRHKKMKKNKHIHPFEIYRNDPETTPASDLVTDIFLPVVA